MAMDYRSPPLDTMMGELRCFCGICGDMQSRNCKAKLRTLEHCENITYIIAECPEIVKILVGPEEVEMTCHKAALGFYSDFFDAAFYGGMVETNEGTIRLPEENKEAVATFISWVYSGQIHSTLSAEELWIMGDCLRSPMFCNDVMYFIFGLYGTPTSKGGRWLSARTFEFIHQNTNQTSRLMSFARNTLKAGGPLCPRAIADEAELDDSKAYELDWHDLIKRGGDLVLSLAVEKAFYEDIYRDPSYDEDQDPGCVAPWKRSNQEKYMFPISERNIKEFLMGKTISALELGKRK